MDTGELISRASRLRRDLHEDATSPIDIFALTLAIEGISLFLYPLGDGISGMILPLLQSTQPCQRDGKVFAGS